MNISGALSSFFLFEGISDADKEKCISVCKMETRVYSKGEAIYSHSDFEKKIGLVLDGECRVERQRNDASSIPLNSLCVGDSFGVLAAFTGRDEFPTVVVAKRLAKILYFSKTELIEMISVSPQISINIINFLAGRIEFLCDKISSFSSDNVEQKLAQYLLSEYKSSNSLTLKINKKHAAESLNSGRTSLYRSLEKLEERGVIKIDKKIIKIIDLEGLERIAK